MDLFNPKTHFSEKFRVQRGKRLVKLFRRKKTNYTSTISIDSQGKKIAKIAASPYLTPYLGDICRVGACCAANLSKSYKVLNYHAQIKKNIF